MRELDERLGFGKLIDEHLADLRANNARFSLADLLRQSVYSHLAGYEDVNDAERLSQEPTFRLMGSERIWDRVQPDSVTGCDNREAGPQKAPHVAVSEESIFGSGGNGSGGLREGMF